MNKTFDCLIQGGEVFLENKIEKTDIVITNGKIIKIIKDSSSISATKIIDANNKWILPGAIDIHCHIRAPAFPERGTVLSETKAAVKGGITTLFEMPISNPCASTPEIIKNSLQEVKRNWPKNYGASKRRLAHDRGTRQATVFEGDLWWRTDTGGNPRVRVVRSNGHRPAVHVQQPGNERHAEQHRLDDVLP